MKDNLKVGVFLMDKDYIIQPAYSIALETIFDTSEIEGKKFSEFIGFLHEKERNAAIKYFKMVLNRSFKTKMLEEINPISEFVYYKGGVEKTLRSTFTAVDRGGAYMIMGVLEDISAQVNLQKELDAEAGKRDEEMRSLFQIVKIDPDVFNDFIDDVESEFKRANEVLKEENFSPVKAIGAVFQGVHAIKSNALILGLDNFSNKLHELENTIRNTRENSNIGVDEMLPIILELEAIMREKDKYRENVDRIVSFMGGDSRRRYKDILIETLMKACEKAGQMEGKKVKFIVDSIDEEVFEYGSRRVIKDVITQLIRNAVAHGIEAPQNRKEIGKNQEGRINLSIKHLNDQIHIRLSDDGAGIDFNNVLKKAQSLNLIKKGDKLDRNALIKVLFNQGFSTTYSANMTSGRGVGLDLVRDRIQEHNGSIKIGTEKGKGTVFNLIIPCKQKLSNVS
jgi:chemotaxis protein histidine kinase CheA